MSQDRIPDVVAEMIAMKEAALQEIYTLEEVSGEKMTHLRLAVSSAIGGAWTATTIAWSVLDRIRTTAGQMKDVIEKAKQK